MKTFKLKKLEILESVDEDIILHEIPLQDGLIINKEDEHDHWLIEAFLENTYQTFFQELADKKDQIMLQVKITKESNAPATFITSIIGINEIGDYINTLFLGTIVDRQKGMVKELLRKLVEEGYQGESLITKFKEMI
ncbi:YwpF family protein [Lentibacillus sp. N15]|uniref:YwpF family protein n=1 Tax=Lentibacillus songyuanensis TaxID=3136161 RepID=UPI0031B9DF49